MGPCGVVLPFKEVLGGALGSPPASPQRIFRDPRHTQEPGGNPAAARYSINNTSPASPGELPQTTMELMLTQHNPGPTQQPLLGVRSAIVLLLGVLTGLGAGALTYLTQKSLPAAGLAVGAGFGAGVLFFHTIIG